MDIRKQILLLCGILIVLISNVLYIIIVRQMEWIKIVLLIILMIICATIGFVSHQRWSKMRNRVSQETNQNETTEWTKLRRGEMVRSFLVWMQRDYCRVIPFIMSSHWAVRQPLPISGDWSGYDASDSTSILMEIDRKIPNAVIYGAREIILRRYSLLSSDVYSDILRITFIYNPSAADPTWMLHSSSIVGRGIVDIMFGRPRFLAQETVVMVDTRRQTYAQVYLAAPIGIRHALRSRRDEERMNRLIILYRIDDWNGYTIRFEVVEHEIELVRHPSKLFARQISNVFFPVVGNLKMETYDGLTLARQGTYFLMGNTTAECKIVTFDQKFNATFRPLDEFVRELRASPIGQRALAAANDFLAMVPEILRRRAYVYLQGSDLIVGRIGDFFVHRYLRPPSLYFQAATTFCRLHPNSDLKIRRRRPNADLSAHENKVGFDIFDEITEESKKPPMMISLSSDLLMID